MTVIQDAADNARRIITALIESSDMQVRFKLPLQVWDNTGSLYGVLMQSDLLMGDQECVSEVSFCLDMTMTDEEISERAIAAMDAVFHRLQVKIVPKEMAKQ